MDKTIICRDCGIPFKISEFSLLKKCEHCLDRDQSYRERGVQDRMEDYASEQQGTN